MTKPLSLQKRLEIAIEAWYEAEQKVIHYKARSEVLRKRMVELMNEEAAERLTPLLEARERAKADEPKFGTREFYALFHVDTRATIKRIHDMTGQMILADLDNVVHKEEEEEEDIEKK